jgi:hypothetical protein
MHLLLAALLLAGGAQNGRPGLHGNAAKRRAAAVSFTNTYSTLFDGSNDYVLIGTPADMDGAPNSREITLSGWFKYTKDPAVDQQQLITKTRDTTDMQYNWVKQTGAGNKTFFAFVGATFTTAVGTLEISTWYHLALVVIDVTGTKTTRLYVNGAQVGPDTNAGATTAACGWVIGSGFGASGGSCSATPSGRNFGGSIDEVSAWNVGLTTAEVQAIYNGGEPGDLSQHSRASTILRWYRMGDGDTYPTLTDHGTAGGVNATMTNMTSGAVNFTTDVP